MSSDFKPYFVIIRCYFNSPKIPKITLFVLFFLILHFFLCSIISSKILRCKSGGHDPEIICNKCIMSDAEEEALSKTTASEISGGNEAAIENEKEESTLLYIQPLFQGPQPAPNTHIIPNPKPPPPNAKLLEMSIKDISLLTEFTLEEFQVSLRDVISCSDQYSIERT